MLARVLVVFCVALLTSANAAHLREHSDARAAPHTTAAAPRKNQRQLTLSPAPGVSDGESALRGLDDGHPRFEQLHAKGICKLIGRPCAYDQFADEKPPPSGGVLPQIMTDDLNNNLGVIQSAIQQGLTFKAAYDNFKKHQGNLSPGRGARAVAVMDRLWSKSSKVRTVAEVLDPTGTIATVNEVAGALLGVMKTCKMFFIIARSPDKQELYQQCLPLIAIDFNFQAVWEAASDAYEEIKGKVEDFAKTGEAMKMGVEWTEDKLPPPGPALAELFS